MKSNVLLLEFIGSDGIGAPKLKDAKIENENYEKVYKDLLKIMRNLFQECKLIHADLSEYNILFWKN